MPELNDADLVRWVITRLVKGLGDSPNCEYILRLVAIAKKLDMEGPLLQRRLDVALDHLQRWTCNQYTPDKFINKDTQELLEKEGRL